jgi:MFS family permease
MLGRRLLTEGNIPSKDFCVVFTLLFNAFAWYYMTLMVIESVPLDLQRIAAFRTIFYVAAIGSGIAGSLFSERIGRLRLLFFWMLLGIISSFSLILVYNVSVGHLSLIFLLQGISFGLGMPSSLAFLADHTAIENRGRISSLIFCAANLSILPFAILFINSNLIMNSIILTAWRGFGLAVFILLRPMEKNYRDAKKPIHFASVFHDRSLILYLLPWLMFSLIDALEKSLIGDFYGPNFGPDFGLIFMIEPVIASFSMLIGGLLSDAIGRKRVVIYGFVSLGIAYAIIGIAPMMITWYVYLIIDGIAAGILLITFILILWGDLSQPYAREKYYLVGSVPFLATKIIPSMLVFIKGFAPNANTAFSLASFFLFLSVLPLMYAPETLPEKKMEIRRLKGYVEQAKKFTEKYTKKNGNKR